MGGKEPHSKRKMSAKESPAATQLLRMAVRNRHHPQDELEEVADAAVEAAEAEVEEGTTGTIGVA
jgi:hypothetical protein